MIIDWIVLYLEESIIGMSAMGNLM